MSPPKFLPLTTYSEYTADEMRERAAEFYREVNRRRTVREFSDRPLDRVVIDYCLRAAALADLV